MNGCRARATARPEGRSTRGRTPIGTATKAGSQTHTGSKGTSWGQDGDNKNRKGWNHGKRWVAHVISEEEEREETIHDAFRLARRRRNGRRPSIMPSGLPESVPHPAGSTPFLLATTAGSTGAFSQQTRRRLGVSGQVSPQAPVRLREQRAGKVPLQEPPFSGAASGFWPTTSATSITAYPGGAGGSTSPGAEARWRSAVPHQTQTHRRIPI